MSAEGLEDREVLYREEFKVLGLDIDTSAAARERAKHCGARVLKVGFPHQAEDPRAVEHGVVENELGEASEYEREKRTGRVESKPFSYRTHLASTHGRPQISPNEVCYPVPLFNLSTNPPSHEITQYKLCQRVEIDAPVETATWEGAVALSRRIDPAGSAPTNVLRGYQSTRLVLAAGLIAEVTYVQEFLHHIQVPIETRLDRCGLTEDSPAFFNVSELIAREAISRGSRRGTPTSEESVYKDGGNCICCWQRTITVRHAEPSELPSGSRQQSFQVDRLADLLDRLCTPGRRSASAHPLAVNVCSVPDINRLNFGPFAEVPANEPFNPVVSNLEREVAYKLGWWRR